MHGYILEFTLSIIENLIIIQIMNYFLTVKSKNIQYLFIILLSLLAQMINTMNTPYKLVYPTALLIVYTIINYKESFILKIIISLSVFILNAYLSFFIISILEMFELPVLTLVLHDTLLYVSLTFIAKFIMITLFFMFRNIVKKYMNHTQTINWKLLLAEIIVFFISFLYSFYIFVCEIVNARVALFLLSFQAITFIITLYFFYKYMRTLKDKENMQHIVQRKMLYNTKSKEQSILYNLAYEDYCQLLSVRDKAYECLKNKKFDEAEKILSTPTATPMIEFGSDTLDFLINSKSDLMAHHGIKFQAIISNSLTLIEPDDVVYILGVLLDCIIEELKGKSGANVNLEITEISAGIKLNIENSPVIDEKKMNEAINKVNQSVEKYQGIIGCFIHENANICKIVFFQDEGGKDGKVIKKDI